ncbi:MAG: hypothetical protein L0227_11970 [Chloroflexi bacterium]|nr:hypothetical protein [Chloroflexota bacterium]
MPVAFLHRARIATVAAIAGALLIAGIAAGAAGGYMILGQANDSGTAQTTLTNAGLGAAFTLKTTNIATGATGIFGWSSSTDQYATRGVYGRADGRNSYGVYAWNNGSSGTGAGLYATAVNNNAIIATAGTTAIVATATSCTGFICFGANGVSATGYGLGAGVFGDGFVGVNGTGAIGVWGTGEGDYGTAIYGDAATGNGVEGYGDLSDGFDALQCADGGSTYCAGGAFEGADGVVGEGEGFIGAGVYAIAGSGLTYALLTNGPAYVQGDLTVTGTCTGCTASVLAENGSNQTIKQGQAVTLLGARTDGNGRPVLLVGPARGNDNVLGIADVEMKSAASVAKIPARNHEVRQADGSTATIKVPARQVTAQRGGLWAGGTSTAAGGTLRVITGGIVTFALADASNGAIKVNDELSVGPNGNVSKAAKVKVGDTEFVAPGTSIGYALGALADGSGMLIVYVSPH